MKSFGLDVKPALGQVDWTFFAEPMRNVDFHRENPMTEIVRLKVETPPDCTGVIKTPAICKVVAEMTDVCIG